MNNQFSERTLLLKIKNNVLKIENLLKRSFSYQLATQLDDGQNVRRRGLRIRRRKRVKPGIVAGIKAKGQSIIDKILNFFIMIVYGWVFTKLQPILPQVAKLLRLLKPVGDFIGFITRGLIEGLSFFISGGYKIYDTIKGKTAEIKSKPLNRAYDDFSAAADKLIDNPQPKGDKRPPTKTEPQKPKGAKTGGIPLTRGNEPIVKPIRRGARMDRPIIVPKKQSAPEVLIADNIRSYYRSNPLEKITRKAPVDNISKISNTLKKTTTLFGDIASAGTDIALGQSPNKGVYKNTAKDVLQLVKLITERTEEQTKRSIMAMDPNTKIKNLPNNTNLVDFIAAVIQRSIESRFNKALSEFKQNLLRTPDEDGVLPTPGVNAPGVEGAMGFSGGYYGAYKPNSAVEKQIYDYLINEKRMNDAQALGLMANIHRESTFRSNAINPSRDSFGLFQWKGARAEAMMKAIPDWKTNWKKQIDYALTEPKNLSMVTPGQYTSIKFKSSEDAADWWAKEWERPANLSDAAAKHKLYLKGIPKAKDGFVKFREPEAPTKAELRTEGGSDPSDFITSGFGMRKHPILGQFREHKGIDISGGGFTEGKPISVIKPGTVIATNDNPSDGGGYGNYVTIKHDDGTYSFYAHLKSVNVKRGDKVSSKDGGIASVIGTLGGTGRSTGPHLHFEVGTGVSGGFLTGQYDPSRVISNYVRGGGKVKIAPQTVTKLTMKDGVEGITENGQWKPKKWTPEEKQRYEKFNKVRRETSGSIINEMLQNVPKKTPIEQLIKRENPKTFIPSGYTSYEKPGGSSVLAIQPIIETRTVSVQNPTPVPFPVQSGSSPSTNYRG